MTRDVRVHVALPGEEVPAGELAFETNAGGALISTTFRYTEAWLRHPACYALCPELPLVTGSRRSTGPRLLPGAISDTGPDRWGRTLLFDAARRAARAGGAAMPSFTDADYVVLADDRTRLGNLRYVDPATGAYLAPPEDDLPTLVDLPDLVAAARAATAHEPVDDAALRLLVAGGTTLGGARPKTSVRTPQGGLALAKLPAADDRWDVQAWEAVVLQLARDAGITVPGFALHRVGPEASVLVLDRFDRAATGRVGYLSAHSLLEQRPDEVVSYVDLVEAMGDVAQDAPAQRAELARRVAFVLAVNDVDDHMRNHGLLRGTRGWRLAPMFDVNPWPREWPEQSTPVAAGGSRTRRDVTELVDSAGAFGLTSDVVRGIVHEVDEVVRAWPRVATSYGIEDPEGGVVATAFRVTAP